ncbi:MAG TPA: hypothetical protein VES91_06945 [Burkholderiaceae bacterium]|nr:hypothetical protein [Burkholderiaceae bacterium]
MTRVTVDDEGGGAARLAAGDKAPHEITNKKYLMKLRIAVTLPMAARSLEQAHLIFVV